MLRFGETNTAKEKFCAAKTNFKFLIGNLDTVIKPLVWILPEMTGSVKTFKVKDGDKGKNNKLMSYHINDEKLLENIKLFGLRLKT